MKATNPSSIGLLASAVLLGLWLVAGPATAGEARPEMVLDLGDNITMKLVQIPAGKFLMGSPADEKGRWPEEGVASANVKDGKTQVEVTISKPFYMGVYTVTMEQFQQFVKQDKRPVSGGQWGNANRRKPGPGEEKLPVTWMKMDDALAFCQWLSEKSGKKVNLPTEAQWEYACRAGTTTRFWFGDKDEGLYKYGNYYDRNVPTREKKGSDRDYRDLPWRDTEHDDGFGDAAPVGSYKPNPWGLYDMHGNVWQICRGWYSKNYSATETKDPTGPATGEVYVLRGGSYMCRAPDCRSASRERRDPWNDAHNQWPTDGFRVIVEEESPEPAAQGAGQTPGGKPAVAPPPATASVLPPKTTPVPYKIVKLPELVLDLEDGVTMKFVKIPAGKFTPVKGGQDDKPGREVQVGSFYLGVYEVTNDQLRKSKAHKLSPPYPQTGSDPATNIAGKNAAAFCAWMSAKTGKLVRLATAAEWQYAARAGTTTKYYFGDDPADMCKYENTCDRSCSRPLPERDVRYDDGFDKTAPVGSFPPNPWGLYDMLGNVCELTSNVWPLHDGIEKEPPHVFYCGGNWRVSGSGTPQGAWGGDNFWSDHIYDFYGFRVAIAIDPKTGEAALAPAAPAAGQAAATGGPATAESAAAPGEHMPNVLRLPDAVIAVLDGGETPLRAQDKGRWTHEDVVVETVVEGDRFTVRLVAPKSAVKQLVLQWKATLDPSAKLLCDAWERGYGDLEWKTLDSKRVMPWYFLYRHNQRTGAAGVMTGPGAMCFWKASGGAIELHADVRSGGDGVMLGARTLGVCTVVQRHGRADQSAFSVLREFCRQMCPKPRLPAQPVYGFNNWYCDGGVNAEGFLGYARFISGLSPDKENRPYAVIDDGWQAGPGVWTRSNGKFPSMKDMADEIRKAGARPGVWTRLLQAPGSAPKEWRMRRDPSVTPGYIAGQVLDPTVPEVRKYVADQVKWIRQWGYELIKDDYSTFEVFGEWGGKMGAQLTKEGWSLTDRSVTTAEAIREHYRNIRDAAGDGAVIIGCNTIGHLAAGIYEVSRIGDDTDAQNWWRTSTMGVNALAFRLAQHGVFFAADPDCVCEIGSPKQPWEKNRQWLDLVARSGAALFISVNREAVNADQEKELTEALRKAAKPQEIGEPLDWMEKRLPAKWLLDGKQVEFQW